MRDNEIFATLRAALLNGLARVNSAAEVKQNYQPTTQGVDSGPTLYFHKLFDRRYGWPQRSEVWNEDLSDFVKTTRQLYESTFQITGVFRQMAEDTTGLTASDLANLGAAILQQDETLTELADAGLSVLRIGQVRNLQIVNGEGQFEAVPSFDFVLKHEQVTLTTTPAAVVKDFRVKSI